MSSTFGGLQLANSALSAAQYGLGVVSQNISNADTPGYVRRTAQQVSVDSVGGVPGIYPRPGGPSGVRDAGTSRMNDPIIDIRARTEYARGAAADTAAGNISAIESIFPEPSDNGLSEQLNTFWNDWTAVANDPGSSAARSVLLQDGVTVATTLNSMSASLDGITAQVQQSLAATATTVNNAATQLANLNAQIAITTATGGDTNNLLDQRDSLLDTISKAVGGTVTINANNSATVVVDGQNLVSGNVAGTVAVSSDQLTIDGTAVNLSSGSASADVIALATTIPNYRAQLDDVADALSSSVNSAQASGYDLSGNAGAAVFGGSGASGISVVLTDPTAIAASGAPGGNLDGSNALALAKAAKSLTSPDSLYTQLVGNLATATAAANQQQTVQSAVTSSVDALRTSASGVSVDEEVSNMLTYQHAYSAASRILTTMDEMLDTLINHTGVVGRA
jgi:flagellar hook-associated protein 1 FlgK